MLPPECGVLRRVRGPTEFSELLQDVHPLTHHHVTGAPSYGNWEYLKIFNPKHAASFRTSAPLLEGREHTRTVLQEEAWPWVQPRLVLIPHLPTTHRWLSLCHGSATPPCKD